MKKKPLTLLEIMIVIFLITLITGAVSYSMRGVLDKGRAFRTEQAKAQLYDMLHLCLADHPHAADIAADPLPYLTELALAKDPAELLKDGWKEKFQITVVGKSDFEVQSTALNKYNAKRKKPSQEE